MLFFFSVIKGKVGVETNKKTVKLARSMNQSRRKWSTVILSILLWMSSLQINIPGKIGFFLFET